MNTPVLGKIRWKYKCKWNLCRRLFRAFTIRQISALSNDNDDEQYATMTSTMKRAISIYNSRNRCSIYGLSARKPFELLSAHGLGLFWCIRKQRDAKIMNQRRWWQRRARWWDAGACSWERFGVPWPHNDRWRRLGLGSGVLRDHLHPFSAGRASAAGDTKVSSCAKIRSSYFAPPVGVRGGTERSVFDT